MSRAVPALRSRSFRSDRIAWLAFVALAALAAAGARAWLHRRVRADHAGAPGSGAFHLTVLAWERVGRGESAAAAQRVGEQLAALRAAGFTAVSLREVADAYHGGPPLPERSVLLTFDGGHLSTYEAVDPLLRRMAWPAAMFLDPRLQDRRDATYLWWDRLGRMVDSGLWELGLLATAPDAARMVERRLRGYRVLASIAQPAAPGPASDPAAPPLAFVSSLFGVNDADADPARLLRVRVPPEWSGRELVERVLLSRAAPRGVSCTDAAPVPAARWVTPVGRLGTGDDGATLAGAPRAEAWLAGGEWAPDFVLEAEVRPERGAFWVVQQEVGSREQWRWGGTGRHLYLQRLRPGAPVEVVSHVELPAPPEGWHALRLVKRGEGVWVEWDGAPVAGMPRRVARWARAHVGFATGSPAEPGRLAFRNVRFAAIPYRVRTVGASPALAEVQALLRDAPCVAAIRPARRPAGAPDDGDFLDMLAARGAWEVVRDAAAPSALRSAGPEDGRRP